jgi:periplasmic mercuric ion binding protein
MMKHLIMIATIAISPLVTIHSAQAAKTSADSTIEAEARELKVGVKGMVCAFCAQGIEKRFKAHDEVESVKVSLQNKFVELKFKEGKRLSKEKIAEILKEAGYDASFGS